VTWAVAAGCTLEGDPFGSATTIVSCVTFAGVVGRRRDMALSDTVSPFRGQLVVSRGKVCRLSDLDCGADDE
jgi:hypothetical protein